MNEVTVKNAITGSAPEISATGSDTNVSLNLVPKGTGKILIDGIEAVSLSSTQTLSNKTLSNPTITSTAGNTISTPANTVVGNRYMALTNSASGYVIESISVGSGLGITASVDPIISINTSVVATLTGTQTLSNKTFGDRVIVDFQSNPTLAGVTGSLIIGSDGTGAHLTLDSNDLQAKANSTATATLQLNRLGGSVTFGADLFNADTTNFIEIGSNQAAGIGANTTTDIGVRLSGSGAIWASRNNGTLLVLNRMRHVSGGTAVEFRTDGTARGDITIAGNTVSYNAFLGSHHTEIEGPAPELGTVMESTGEMVEGFLYDQGRLPKCKVSDTISSKAVFGVYLSEHHNDNGTIGHLVAALGAGWVRMSANSSPVLGDLIDSNGDGCAKVQDDDVIKSSTIGKISSTVEIELYDDGSYLLPCVLYCG